jgi:hypothetical protein
MSRTAENTLSSPYWLSSPSYFGLLSYLSLTTDTSNWLYISGVPVLLIRVAQLHRTSSEGAEFCRRKRHRGVRAILTGDSISEACGWKEVIIDPNTRVRLLRLPAMQGKGSWDASRVSSTLGATCVMYTYNSASIHHAADR